MLQPRILDLNEVVADVEKMLRRVIGEDIQLVTTPGAGIGRIRADPGQIEQVLMNLVVNARDAMPKGGRRIFETANVALDDTYVRAHRSSSLATVFGIVQQSGGSISVDSRLGLGTTCRIDFPRVEHDLPRPPPAPPGAALSRGTETVLLVEDADPLRVMIDEILEAAGYTVLECSDPEDALRQVGTLNAPVHLMLTDVVMPGLSGPDLARSVQIARPEIKVLFMSGYTDEAMGLPRPHFQGCPDPTFLAYAMARRLLPP